MQSAATKTREPARVACPHCARVVFDGGVVRARVLKVLDHGCMAKCQCKAWIRVPLVYAL